MRLDKDNDHDYVNKINFYLNFRDWMERPFTNLCYHFSTKFETYFNANLECQSLGGNMVRKLKIEYSIIHRVKDR